MKMTQELAIIRCTLDAMKFFLDQPTEESTNKFYRNSDLEKILGWGELSEETTAHCRKFLDARKEWGFLYTGLPLSIYDEVGSWGFFSEELLWMDSNTLDKCLEACRKIQGKYKEVDTLTEIAA